MKKNIFFILVITLCLLHAETLFEVKDASDNVVLDVSTDGLRIMNLGDTLMVISATEIKANLESSKGLSRSFSVTTTQSKGSGDLMRLTSDSTRFWISDTGSGFGVASQSAGKDKSVSTNFLKVSNLSTQMFEGNTGGKYTDFSEDNIFIGMNSGSNTVPDASNEGKYNVFVGNNAGYSNVSGRNNIFIGDNAGYLSDGWHFNTIIGSNAGYNNNMSDNTFVGCSAGYANVSGGANCVFGTFASALNASGNKNSIFGHGAGIYLEAGDENTLIGNDAGRGAGAGGSDSYYNCLIGSESGRDATGNSNVMVGRQAGLSNTTGSGNVFLGNQAGYSETGSNKLYIDNSTTASPLIYGDFSANSVKVNGSLAVSTGAAVNEFSIDGTMASNSDAALPTEKAVRTYVSSYVSANGDNLGSHIATQNIRLSGYYLSNDGGNEGVFVDTGGDVGIGTGSPGNNRLKVTGINSGITGAAGYFSNTNTAGIGLSAFATTTDVVLYAENQNTSSTTANIAKFASTYGGWSEKFTFRSTGRLYAPYLASGTGTAAYITSSGELVKYSSSKKYKKDIEDLKIDSDKLMRLRPVSFKWNEKSASEHKPDYGLIAEDVEKIDPELAVYNDDGNVEGVNYQKINIMLLKVVQDQQKKIDELEKRIMRAEQLK